MMKKENEHKLWIISIDPDDVLNRVIQDSNYREHAMGDNGGEIYILMENDSILFQKLLKSAIAELYLKIGRMAKWLVDGIDYTDDFTKIKLKIGRNHDNNMLFSMKTFIEEFVDNIVLREWYLRNKLNDEALVCDNSAKNALSNVITVVHYRKKAVKRPIDPLF